MLFTSSNKLLRNINFIGPWFVVDYVLTPGARGCADILLTIVIVDKITVTKHQSNRELIGQELGNLHPVSFGVPDAGTTMFS